MWKLKLHEKVNDLITIDFCKTFEDVERLFTNQFIELTDELKSNGAKIEVIKHQEHVTSFKIYDYELLIKINKEGNIECYRAGKDDSVLLIAEILFNDGRYQVTRSGVENIFELAYEELWN